MNKTQRKILSLLPEGCELRMVKGGHYEILMPDGRPLRLADGRALRAPGSPSDHRVWKNLATSIRWAAAHHHRWVDEDGRPI